MEVEIGILIAAAVIVTVLIIVATARIAARHRAAIGRHARPSERLPRKSEPGQGPEH